MAFANNPRSFNRANVEALDPHQMGCYGLYNANGWVYIGRGDIRERLLAHLNGDNACITRNAPTHWVDIVTSNHVAEEKALILQWDPVCNRKVG